MKMEQAECFERSAYKFQTPGKYPEESVQLYVCSHNMSAWHGVGKLFIYIFFMFKW